MRKSVAAILFLLCFVNQPVSGAEDAAEAALARGDLDEALGIYSERIDADPTNQELLAVAATLAAEVGLPDLAAEYLIRRADNAVLTRDFDTLLASNARLDELYSLLPAAYNDASEAAAAFDPDLEDAVMAWQEMTMAARESLEAGEVEAAFEAQDSAVLIVTETLGENHLFSILAQRDMGTVYATMGDAEQAEASYSEALAASQELLGEDHPSTIEILLDLAALYASMGDPESAAALWDSAAATLEGSLGPGHELVLSALFALSNGLIEAGDRDQASDALQAVCAAVEATRGHHHPYVAACLIQQASLMTDMGRLAEAEGLYTAAIKQMGATSPVINEAAFSTLAQLAEVLRLAGRHQESKDLLSGVIMAATQLGKTDSVQLARSYLGRVFRDEGRLADAVAVTESVLDFGLEHWQEQPEQLLNTLLELGSVYQSLGRLPDAEATFEEAYAGFIDVLGENHPSTVVALNNLGQVYEKEGLFDEAEPLLKQAVQQFESLYGDAHPESARARNNLALLHESQGSFREAEPLYLKTLAVLEDALGAEHPDTIGVRNNLAFLYMLMEAYDQAEPMFETVRDQWQRQFGPDHQNTLKAANNLARVHHRQGQLANAEALMTDTLARRRATLGDNHLDVVRSMIDLGVVFADMGRLPEADAMLTDALRRAEFVLGNQHPYTFDALNGLARVKELLGLDVAAVEVRALGFQRRTVFLDRLLWVTGENAREGYLRLHKPEFDDYIALLSRSKSPDVGKQLIEASIKRKGLLLKITSEIQQIAQLSKDPALTKLGADLEDARKDLASMTLSGPTAETGDRHAEVLYELEQKVNELQGRLGRASVRYRSSIASVTPDIIAASLDRDVAIVDFLSYEEGGEGKMLAGVMISEDGEVRYGVVRLAGKEAIEEAVLGYRSMIQDDSADEDEILEAGQAAHAIIWQPVLDVIGDINYVYLIPDGILNILPFNAMVNDDEQYVIQSHDLHILTSGRDLLPNEYKLAEGDYVILAGPNYDSKDVVNEEERQAALGRRSSALQLGIRGGASGLRGLSFNPLPGAEEEGRLITNQVEAQARERQVYFQDEAQEEVLANMTEPPQLLHVATHGFFLEADDTLRKRLLKLQRGSDQHVPPPGDNPLLRAGLAFAGINTNAQFLGDIDTVNDGVLTALEVLGLNLTGTRLVVLSACETGLGEIHEGEGVYGLRRSFQEAGVAEVISSLWEVSDAGTQALMTEFYTRLLGGQPAREALRETQLSMMDSPEWGYPYIWSAFMIVGSYESAGYSIQ